MDNINLELNSVFKRIIKKQNLPKDLLDNLNEKINNKDPMEVKHIYVQQYAENF